MATTEVLQLAKKALDKSRKAYADYEQEVKEWYRDNPGYQYPYCPHGTSLITDYDPMCGDCENGYQNFHYESEARDAIDAAKYAVAERDKRVDAIVHLFTKLGATWDDLQSPDHINEWIKRPTNIR